MYTEVVILPEVRGRGSGIGGAAGAFGTRAGEALRKGLPRRPYGSNAKIRFQSSFMLTTTQPFRPASSISDGGKVPKGVSGRPLAGP